ncbi:NAD(P)-dependent oxidoreductase [Nocardia cyriacigeorgica]|uniref:NAD(P)-dependent oxidoreductase n=1 Tax=Nocardia cyriacigeorgica TaxID=135487 RepID=UPI0013D7CC3A|nr:NAD(P)-dependent oxidoreductase [Nocardia cyriacigeorgica]NEW26205.1 NAD(P)-dependent oxidoreductase [Nocardia cyriacigeorgica]
MSEHSRTAAVLGTGTIGAPVARNLRKAFAVRAWNRTAAAAQPLAADGIQVSPTPAAAASGAHVVVTVLTDAAAVREVVEAAAPAPGTVWVQMSTVGDNDTAELAAFADERELVFYDAPVQGTKQPAELGRLVVLAAGPESERDTANAVFDAIGSRTLWVADRPGAATRLKLALNSLVFALTHGMAESLSLAEALGVDPHIVVEAVSGGPLDSGFFRAKSDAALSGDFAPAFSITNAIKDSRLILAAAQRAGVAADLAAAGLDRFRRAADAGHGSADMAASYLAR